MIKKRAAVFFVIFLLSIQLIQFVSAQSEGISNLINSVGDVINTLYNEVITPLAKFIIGTEAASEENGDKVFFTMILMFILLMSVIWFIAEYVPIIGGNGWIQFIVSFFVSIVTIRFIATAEGTKWFNSILLPNQTLGIALLCLLPLIFYFVFVQNVGQNRPGLRKILYVFAIVIFLFLYFSRYEDLGKPGESFWNPANLYFCASVLSFALLLFDGTITRAWNEGKAESALAGGKKRLARQLLRQIDELNDDWAHGRVVDYSGRPDRTRYNREMEDLRRRYNELASH